MIQKQVLNIQGLLVICKFKEKNCNELRSSTSLIQYFHVIFFKI